MIISIFILSFLLAASVIINIYVCKTTSKILIENKQHNYDKTLYYRQERDVKALFAILKGIPDYSEHIAVYRISVQNGMSFATLIKVFTDDNEDLNLRNAEELCRMLNSK